MIMRDKGFTLIEVLIAMVVLSIGILSLQMMQVKSIDENSDAGGISAKSMMAASVIEDIMRRPYDDPLLRDCDPTDPTFDCDGTNQDNNFDGLDDQDDGDINKNNVNEDFGLKDWQCCRNGMDPRGNVVAGCIRKADQCAFYDEYDVYWNIAVDYPVENTKTINIIVVNQKDKNAQTVRAFNRAEYTYIKDDII